MKRTTYLLAAICGTAMVFSGCESSVGTGAGVGAASGAVLGGLIGGSARSAAIGAAAGAGAGALGGKIAEDHQKQKDAEYVGQ